MNSKSPTSNRKLNSLWPSNARWHHRIWSTLVNVMACRLMAPSQSFLNQCWLISSEVWWNLFEGNFTGNAQENYKFQITTTSPMANELTHWGRVTHICIGKVTIIGSDNGLSPARREAIIWTNAEILLIGPLETNVSEILIRIHTFSFKKMHLKMSSAKWHPFCLGLNDDRVQIMIVAPFALTPFIVKSLSATNLWNMKNLYLSLGRISSTCTTSALDQCLKNTNMFTSQQLSICRVKYLPQLSYVVYTDGLVQDYGNSSVSWLLQYCPCQCNPS